MSLSCPEEQKLRFRRPDHFAALRDPSRPKSKETKPYRVHAPPERLAAEAPGPLQVRRWSSELTNSPVPGIPRTLQANPQRSPVPLRNPGRTDYLALLQHNPWALGGGGGGGGETSVTRKTPIRECHSCCRHIWCVLMVREFVPQTAAQSASIANHGAADFRRSRKRQRNAQSIWNSAHSENDNREAMKWQSGMR